MVSFLFETLPPECPLPLSLRKTDPFRVSMLTGGYGGYAPQQGAYGQQPQGYGANDPFAQQYNNGGGYQQQQQQQAYVPPVRQASAVSSSPFTRTLPDSNAPAPAKAPTVSLSIGGKTVSAPPAAKSDAKPATVSLSIGGSKPAASKSSTPSSSKPSTPAPGSSSVAATAGTSSGGSVKKQDAAEKKIEQMDKKQEKIEQKVKKQEAKRDEKVEKEEKDSEKIAEEIKASVDEETLVDLFGEDAGAFMKWFPIISSLSLNLRLMNRFLWSMQVKILNLI